MTPLIKDPEDSTLDALIEALRESNHEDRMNRAAKIRTKRLSARQRKHKKRIKHT